MLFFRFGRVLVFCLPLVLALGAMGGCNQQAPTDKVTEQEQLKELDQARQKEWNNQ